VRQHHIGENAIMSKQETLRQLINSFKQEPSDITESRIFSKFASLQKELEVMKRLRSEAVQLVAELTKENAVLRASVPPVKPQENKPFDIEAAKRGEPIEYFTGLSWEDCQFIGLRPCGSPVIEFENVVFTIFGTGNLRMKQTTQDIVMYANVYRLTSGRFSIGSLHETPNEARRNAAGDTSFVAMTQVTFTVTK
jgi:hypothetical protein